MSMGRQFAFDDRRTPEQIREHYEVERELARRLRDASPQERRLLYSSLYNELFRRVPHHPQLTRKASQAESAHYVAGQLRYLTPFLNETITFLEVGPGDCGLSLAVAARVKRVYAVDVSHEITKGLNVPPNFELIISDGSSIPVPACSVDLVYSNQLMEHLHPDDAAAQLRNIYAALAPGGRYVCCTPHKITGPHDISSFFDDVATGFHLREYTVGELDELFRVVGFSKVTVLLGGRGLYTIVPTRLPIVSERLLQRLRPGTARALAARLPLRLLFGLRMVGTK
jgi:SAM-dependent methyltransferase